MGVVEGKEENIDEVVLNVINKFILGFDKIFILLDKVECLYCVGKFWDDCLRDIIVKFIFYCDRVFVYVKKSNFKMYN